MDKRQLQLADEAYELHRCLFLAVLAEERKRDSAGHPVGDSSRLNRLAKAAANRWHRRLVVLS